MTRLAFEGGWSLDVDDRAPNRLTSQVPPAHEVHDRRKPERAAYELAGPTDWGWAVIDENGDDPHLEGTRENEGTILTCWVSYPNAQDREWALSVWRAAQWSSSET